MPTLPKDLLAAEKEVQRSVLNFIKTNPQSSQAIYLKFEGLKILPLSIRLFENIRTIYQDVNLIFLDAGSTALAKNSYEKYKKNIYSIKDYLAKEDSNVPNRILIVINPGPYDYEQFEQLCAFHKGSIIVLNGKFDDSIVGIGSVARERRKGFLTSIVTSYWLQPLINGALSYSYSDDWHLFRLTSIGYKFIESFKNQPSNEDIYEKLGDL